MVSNPGGTWVGELEITRRISPVAICCSRASVRARSSSAYEARGEPLVGGRLRGVPHSRQNLWLVGFSCWHRGHCIARPPSEPGRKRSDRCRELSLGAQNGQGNWICGGLGAVAMWPSRFSEITQELAWSAACPRTLSSFGRPCGGRP